MSEKRTSRRKKGQSVEYSPLRNHRVPRRVKSTNSPEEEQPSPSASVTLKVEKTDSENSDEVFSDAKSSPGELFHSDPDTTVLKSPIEPEIHSSWLFRQVKVDTSEVFELSYLFESREKTTTMTSASGPADYSLMPKYNKALTSREVSLFLKQYKLWGTQQKLSDNAMKASLALAFQNEDAQRWCLLNVDAAHDTTVKYDAFVKSFLEEAPLQHNSSGVEIMKLMSEPPGQNEQISSYLIRIRYNLGDDWDTANEQNNTRLLLENLPRSIVAYIDCKGNKPDTFKKLLKLVREYEQQGHDNFSTHPNVKVEANVSAAASEEFSDMKTLMQVLIREVAEIKSSSATQQNRNINPNSRGSNMRRGNNNFQNQNSGRSRPPTCYTCNKPGHLARNCYSNNNFRGRGRGRGRGGARVFQNSGYYQYVPYQPTAPPNQQWQSFPALQQQQPSQPIVTYPTHTGN